MKIKFPLDNITIIPTEFHLHPSGSSPSSEGIIQTLLNRPIMSQFSKRNDGNWGREPHPS